MLISPRTLVLRLFVCVSTIALLASCGDDSSSSNTGTASTSSSSSGTSTTADLDAGQTSSDAGDDDADTGEPQELGRLCVAVRGNGSRIFAHFGALARIHEHYGLVDGISGGSSASITSFLTESVYMNPGLFACGDDGQERCSDEVAALRVSLLIKSFQGYFVVLSNTDEAIAFQQLAPIVARVREEGVGELVEGGQLDEARQALLAILTSQDLIDLINPEVLDLLGQSPNRDFHTAEIWEMIQTFGSFAVDSPKIFIRPGLASFESFARIIGRIGSFYAGYGPQLDVVDWPVFLERCAPESKGKTWAEIAEIPLPGDETCGQVFGRMAQSWRDGLVADEDAYPSRIDDPIGKNLTAVISTGVLTGPSVDVYRQARAQYAQAEEFTFDVSFDDVRFGYWGQNEDLTALRNNARGYTDAKTARTLTLDPNSTWFDALSKSPAEPGLASGIDFADGNVSVGGWSDLAPVLVLRNVGCDDVILITRRGPVIGGFGDQVATQLGMNDTERNDLYAIDQANSGIDISLREATGVWCTDWDAYGGFDFEGVWGDAYNAPLQTTSKALSDAPNAYTNTTTPDTLSAVGCTPGVVE